MLIAIPVLMVLAILLLKNRRAEMRIANILQLGIKELRGLARDPMLLLLIVYAFTLAVYTSARAQPENLSNAAIAIVDEDQSPVSSRITAAFIRLISCRPNSFRPTKWTVAWMRGWTRLR